MIPRFWDRHFVTLEADARRLLFPTMDSAVVVAIICPGPDALDVKVALELGAALYLGKPTLLLVPPGRTPPGRLAEVVDRVLEVPDDPSDWPELVDAAVDEMLR